MAAIGCPIIEAKYRIMSKSASISAAAPQKRKSRQAQKSCRAARPPPRATQPRIESMKRCQQGNRGELFDLYHMKHLKRLARIDNRMLYDIEQLRGNAASMRGICATSESC